MVAVAMKHTYRIETLVFGKWVPFAGSECGREYGLGYVAARREMPGPRFGVRLVRDDGKIIDEAPELGEVSIGPVAGWPTAAQYRAAGIRALQRAYELDKRGGR